MSATSASTSRCSAISMVRTSPGRPPGCSSPRHDMPAEPARTTPLDTSPRPSASHKLTEGHTWYIFAPPQPELTTLQVVNVCTAILKFSPGDVSWCELAAKLKGGPDGSRSKLDKAEFLLKGNKAARRYGLRFAVAKWKALRASGVSHFGR